MRVTVVGTGYVGLVTAACLAEIGHVVVGVDADHAKVHALANGHVSIHEPGLEPIVKRHLRTGRLAFTSDMAVACHGAELVFIAVGTPAAGPGFADLGYVMSAARAVGEHLDGPATVVVKSTVPPGTCARVRATVQACLIARGARHRISVASNPEFLREGCAVNDFMRPDRIVVGAEEAAAAERLEHVYGLLVALGHPLLIMDLASAEMAKYAANAMLAVRISLVNELAAVAEVCNADYESVRAVLATDRRIGPHFLAAGAGYGGSCFPKDMRALARLALDAGVETPLVVTAEAVNRRACERLVDKVARWAEARGGLHRCTVAVWGLAFKPGTDDVRESPAVAAVRRLLDAGARVRAHDPAAQTTARGVLGDAAALTWADSALDALRGADTLLLLTEWEAYRRVDPAAVAARLRSSVIFDGRNALDVTAYRNQGLAVVGVGRPRIAQAPPKSPATAAPAISALPEAVG